MILFAVIKRVPSGDLVVEAGLGAVGAVINGDTAEIDFDRSLALGVPTASNEGSFNEGVGIDCWVNPADETQVVVRAPNGMPEIGTNHRLRIAVFL